MTYSCFYSMHAKHLSTAADDVSYAKWRPRPSVHIAASYTCQGHSSTCLRCCLLLSFTSSPSFPSSLAHPSPSLLVYVSCCCLLRADSGGVNSSKCLLDLVFRIEPLSRATPLRVPYHRKKRLCTSTSQFHRFEPDFLGMLSTSEKAAQKHEAPYWWYVCSWHACAAQQKGDVLLPSANENAAIKKSFGRPFV